MTDQQPGGSGAGRFFDAHQRETVEAAMARIIPTDDQPGAREAGTIDFLDRYLSSIDFVYAKPDGSGFEKIEGKRAEAWQKRLDIVRGKYVEGIKELDRRSQAGFGKDFVRLTDEQQDHILADIERPAQWTEHNLELAQVTVGYGAPVEPALQQTSAEVDVPFFVLLALHTRQGFYADPIYGGNRDRVGWRLIGFEGPESLAETHAGRYTTLPFFAEQQIDWEKEKTHGAEA
jgi:gluconate 2-dehydrogenase gamma chain